MKKYLLFLKISDIINFAVWKLHRILIGGADRWRNVKFAGRALRSELKSATPIEEATGLGNRISEK